MRLSALLAPFVGFVAVLLVGGAQAEQKVYRIGFLWGLPPISEWTADVDFALTAIPEDTVTETGLVMGHAPFDSAQSGYQTELMEGFVSSLQVKVCAGNDAKAAPWWQAAIGRWSPGSPPVFRSKPLLRFSSWARVLKNRRPFCGSGYAS